MDIQKAQQEQELAHKKQMAALTRKRLVAWLNAFGTNADRNTKLAINQLGVVDGLKAQPILSMLRNGVKENEISVVIDMMLLKFSTFFNITRNLNEEQIGQTTDFIMTEFSDMSFEAIQHFLNCIMMGKEPFADNMYSGLDGRKVLELLRRYREYQITERERRIENRSSALNQGAEKLVLMGASQSPELAEKLKALRVEQQRDKARRQNEAHRKREEEKERQAQDLIRQWTEEYNQMESPVGSLQEYLQYQAESWMEEQKKH